MAEELTLFSVGATDPRRMGTKRIAELTGKQHKDVLRDVRVICEELGVTPLVVTAQNCAVDFEGVTAELYPNGDVAQYYLTERYLLTLATGYSVKLRVAIIDEWEQLKKKQQQQQALPDFTDPIAAALAVAEYAQKYAAEYKRNQKLLAANTELENKNAVLTPKAHIADMIANAERTWTMGAVAKMFDFEIGRNRLFEFLRQHKILFRENGINLPYQKYMELGYFTVKMNNVQRDDGRGERVVPQVLFTGKGIGFLARLLEKEHKRTRATIDRTIWHGPGGLEDGGDDEGDDERPYTN